MRTHLLTLLTIVAIANVTPAPAARISRDDPTLAAAHSPRNSTLPVLTVDANVLVTNRAPFQSFPDHLQQTLSDARFVQNVTDSLVAERFFTGPLLPVAGPLRVVIVQPAELALLQTRGITIKDVEDIAYNNYIVYTIFWLGCIGRSIVNGTEVAYIEAESRNWVAMRRDIEALWVKRGGAKQGGFAANAFHPHIVIAESNLDAVPDDSVEGDGHCVAQTRNEDPVGITIQQLPEPPALSM